MESLSHSPYFGTLGKNGLINACIKGSLKHSAMIDTLPLAVTFGTAMSVPNVTTQSSKTSIPIGSVV